MSYFDTITRWGVTFTFGDILNDIGIKGDTAIKQGTGIDPKNVEKFCTARLDSLQPKMKLSFDQVKNVRITATDYRKSYMIPVKELTDDDKFMLCIYADGNEQESWVEKVFDEWLCQKILQWDEYLIKGIVIFRGDTLEINI